MKCLDDKKIEKFADLLTSNSEVEATWIEHIDKCSFCTNRLNEILTFEKNLYSFYNRAVSPKEEAVFRKIVANNKRIKIAYPIVPKKPIIKNSAAVLSAANDIKPKSLKYENVATLKTGDDAILVRIMRNIVTNEYSMFIISEDKNKYDKVLVFLSFLNKEFVSDENGEIELGKIDLPNNEDISVQIQIKEINHQGTKPQR